MALSAAARVSQCGAPEEEETEEVTMALQYEDLDEHTREFMLRELDLDLSNGTVYIGSTAKLAR